MKKLSKVFLGSNSVNRQIYVAYMYIILIDLIMASLQEIFFFLGGGGGD